jgi:hypothetical protein
MKRLLVFAVIGAGGCATVPKTAIVDGKEVARATLEFNGQPYTVKHEGAHPRPGGASSGLRDAGGSIRGRVCGMLFDLDVTHKGDHVQLVGSIDNHIPAAIDVRDEGGGARHFTGNLGTLGVDFVLVPGAMQGHVGIRVFALEASADELHGHMRVPNIRGALPVMITGREALLAMPAADQAAVLPALMTCQTASGQFNAAEAIVLGVGGEATDRPPETSAVYTHGY